LYHHGVATVNNVKINWNFFKMASGKLLQIWLFGFIDTHPVSEVFAELDVRQANSATDMQSLCNG